LNNLILCARVTQTACTSSYARWTCHDVSILQVIPIPVACFCNITTASVPPQTNTCISVIFLFITNHALLHLTKLARNILSLHSLQEPCTIIHRMRVLWLFRN